MLAMLFTAGGARWAQSTAHLIGRVTDASGAVLPGVTVTVTQTATGRRERRDRRDGAYVLPNLPTGPYRLEVSLAGFRSYVQTGIVLQVGATPTINARSRSAISRSRSRSKPAPLVDVRSAGISEVVENERIVELPLQGRQVTSLLCWPAPRSTAGARQPRYNPGGVSHLRRRRPVLRRRVPS